MNDKIKIPLSKLECNGDWQEEVRKFVGREVYYCASCLISELVKDEKHMEDLWPICTKDNWIDAANEHPDNKDTFTDENEAREYCEANNLDPYTVEAFEHWIISNWLADKLEAKGEMILRDFLGLTLWGRTTTGQAIYIDRVINEIYLENCISDQKIETLAKELGLTQLDLF